MTAENRISVKIVQEFRRLTLQSVPSLRPSWRQSWGLFSPGERNCLNTLRGLGSESTLRPYATQIFLTAGQMAHRRPTEPVFAGLFSSKMKPVRMATAQTGGLPMGAASRLLTRGRRAAPGRGRSSRWRRRGQEERSRAPQFFVKTGHPSSGVIHR